MLNPNESENTQTQGENGHSGEQQNSQGVVLRLIEKQREELRSRRWAEDIHHWEENYEARHGHDQQHTS